MDITPFLINELLESSSSSDEDEELILKLIYRIPQPQSRGFAEDVIHTYSDTEFKKNFRISRESAAHLIEKYSQSYLKRRYKGGRLQTSVETQILLFLWFSGNQTTFREVANLFDISISNVHKCFNNVLNFLVNEIAPRVIKFPTVNEEKEAVANEFEKICRIPNVLGCIGRSYIAARKRKYKSLDENKQNGVSMTMQGICDSNLKFLDVFAGNYSKTHDSGVLSLSVIGKELPSLCSGKYYLLGDTQYNLREFLLTPYRDCSGLSESEKNFNFHLHLARVKIKNTFCLLKNRFRQLMRIDFHDVEIMAKFVTACCVLHNICIDRNENLSEEIVNTELNNNNEDPMESEGDAPLTHLGRVKRDKVKHQLFNEFNLNI